MRAIVLDGTGGTEVLRLRECDDPVPGPDEILVDVAATALNRADLLERRGLYPAPPLAGFPLPSPAIPGMEFSGRVAACGARVTRWSPGDAVMGIVNGGAYASRLVIHELQAMRVPEGIDLVDAAAIPEVWITAWDALVLQGGLTSGRTALVHAGASGVGTAAIQLCRALGARVVVPASTAKCGACVALGADLAVDHTSDDFVVRALECTGGIGVDVVLDVIGGDYVDRNIAALRVGGTIVQVGVMGGGRTEVNIGLLMPKRATLRGTVLRARPLDEKIAVSRRFAAEVLPLFDAGIVHPVIDSRYAIDEIAAAHERMEANANIGKIIVTM